MRSSSVAPLLVLLAALICFLSVTQPTEAASDSDYDYNVLALFWQPEQCAGSKSGGCTRPRYDFQASNLVIHGLWPNYYSRRNGEPGPSDCPSQYGRRVSSGTIADLSSELQRYWPSNLYPGDGFWQHEWSKHGTCSGLSPTEYFETSIKLLKKVGTPWAIQNAIGRTIHENDFFDAFKPAGEKGSDKWVGFKCEGTSLSDAYLCFDKQYNQIKCPPSIGRENCPGTQVEIAKLWPVSTVDPCDNTIKAACMRTFRKGCNSGSTECGGCISGYDEKGSGNSLRCEKGDACSSDVKDKCDKLHRAPCVSGSETCGACLPGYVASGQDCRTPSGISVKQPVPYSVFTMGTDHLSITWSSSSCSQYVKISILESGKFIEDVSAHTKDDGSYGYMPSPATFKNSEYYQIRIQADPPKAGCDVTSEHFTIKK